MPAVLLSIADELFVQKAAISEEGDLAGKRQQRPDAIEHLLVGLETDHRAGMPHGLPCQRDRAPAIDQRGADQDKRCEHGGIEGYIHMGGGCPIAERGFEHWGIPDRRVNCGVMEPACKPPNPACGVGCAPLDNFGPGGQAHGSCQTQTDDRPGQRDHTADIVIDTAGNVRE